MVLGNVGFPDLGISYRSACGWLLHDVESVVEPRHLCVVRRCCRVGVAAIHAEQKTDGVPSSHCRVQLCDGPAQRLHFRRGLWATFTFQTILLITVLRVCQVFANSSPSVHWQCLSGSACSSASTVSCCGNLYWLQNTVVIRLCQLQHTTA